MATNSSSIPPMDLGEESLERPCPINRLIRGTRLLSLEEAVMPLRPMLHSIEEMVSTVKRNCRENDDLLTVDEAAAIYLLTMPSIHGESLLKLLNQNLRTHRREDLREWSFYVKLLLTALHKLPDYRGIVFSRTSETNVITKFARGTNMVLWGLNICSASISEMHETNKTKDAEHSVLVITDCFNGKNITKYAYFQGQNDQIILLPDSSFKVERHFSTQSRVFICQRPVEDFPNMVDERQFLGESYMREREELSRIFYGAPMMPTFPSMPTEMFSGILRARPFDEFVDDRKEEDQPKGKPKK